MVVAIWAALAEATLLALVEVRPWRTSTTSTLAWEGVVSTAGFMTQSAPIARMTRHTPRLTPAPSEGGADRGIGGSRLSLRGPRGELADNKPPALRGEPSSPRQLPARSGLEHRASSSVCVSLAHYSTCKLRPSRDHYIQAYITTLAGRPHRERSRQSKPGAGRFRRLRYISINIASRWLELKDGDRDPVANDM